MTKLQALIAEQEAQNKAQGLPSAPTTSQALAREHLVRTGQDGVLVHAIDPMTALQAAHSISDLDDAIAPEKEELAQAAAFATPSIPAQAARVETVSEATNEQPTPVAETTKPPKNPNFPADHPLNR